jgi:predicted RNA binding protein YcfA (HicA-like mRNA interferase family)
LSRLVPISRAKLIRRLKKLGFDGPFPGSDHNFMVRGDNFVRIPNVHRREIGVNLIAEILREGGISREDWLSAE